MTIISAVQNYFGEMGRKQRFYRTQRLIRSLPPEILRDIGWPGAAGGIDDPAFQQRLQRPH